MHKRLEQILAQLRELHTLLASITQEIRGAIAAYKELHDLLATDLEAEAVTKIHGITETVSGETVQMQNVLDHTSQP